MITISKYNEVYAYIDCDDSAAYSISDEFTFQIDQAWFSPKVRSGKWDGKIRLFNIKKRQIYMGLVPKVIAYLEENDYEYQNLIKDNDYPENFDEFIESLGLPEGIEERDYQIDAVKETIKKQRIVLLSPTASGKSFIMYLIHKWFDVKTLITVPTLGLIEQLAGDFIEYGMDPKEVHKIYSGQEKNTEAKVTISTWQSIHEMDESFYSDYEMILGDEVHGYKAKSLINIMQNCTNTRIRVGLTGTLDESILNPITIQGLFGEIYEVEQTKNLIEKGFLATILITVVMLKYGEDECELTSSMTFQEESEFLCSHKGRNKFLCNLSNSLDGNSLLLFAKRDHGRTLQEGLKNSKKKVFYVDGTIPPQERERIRNYAENNDNVIVVASYGTFSTGINIKNLDNIIFGSPVKSKIRLLQSIGRGLRKNTDDAHLNVYDISDNLKHGRKENYSYKQLKSRLKKFAEQEFPFKLLTYRISDGEKKRKTRKLRKQ